MKRSFNPRAPCGARPPPPHACHTREGFQSTRPVRGATLFQSTRPVRGATSSTSTETTRRGRFNPRAPCGARRRIINGTTRQGRFQSTRPVRGATPTPARLSHARGVSIHAPRAGRESTRPVRGATRRLRGCSVRPRCFNPRAPCGARPRREGRVGRRRAVSIHAPRAGRDLRFICYQSSII